MKTTHKKTSPSISRGKKFGYTSFSIKKMRSVFKFNRPQQNQEIKSYATIGFTRIEKEELLKTEAEARRNQGRVYANITPIR
jgi:hypothetical protein